MESFRDLAIFVEVARARSISRAADKLGVSKSQISRRLSELERTLGVGLLTRTTRRIDLTEAGEVYFRRLEEIVAAADEASRRLSDFVTAPRGRLSLSTTVELARLGVADAIAAYAQRYPEVTVEVDLSARRVDLVAEGVDVAIRVGEQSDPRLIGQRVGQMRLALYASPQFLQRHGVPLRPEDLAGLPVIRNQSASDPSRWRLSGLPGQGQTQAVDVEVSGPILVNNFGVMRQLALRGLGVAALHEPMIGADIAAGRLIQVLEAWRAGEKSVYMLTTTRQLPAKTRLFVEMAAPQLRKRLG